MNMEDELFNAEISAEIQTEIEMSKLREINADLVAAMQEIAFGPMGKSAAVKEIARAALKKAGVL